MPTIAEYWSDDHNTTPDVDRKLEVLEFQAKKHVMDVTHALSQAEQERDAYISSLKDIPNPSYEKVIEHFDNVQQHRKAAAEANKHYIVCFDNTQPTDN
jgi:hypothetical protein